VDEIGVQADKRTQTFAVEILCLPRSLPKKANEISAPEAIVVTLFPGASPSQVESLLTNALEEMPPKKIGRVIGIAGSRRRPKKQPVAHISLASSAMLWDTFFETSHPLLDRIRSAASFQHLFVCYF
jgi:hypothetical protein